MNFRTLNRGATVAHLCAFGPGCSNPLVRQIPTQRMFLRTFSGFRSAAAVTAAVLAAGCASRPPRLAPTTVGPEQAAAIARIADAEWRRWGSGWAMSPAVQAAGEGSCAVLADGSCRPVDDGCGREQSAALCPVVNEYWRALGRAGTGRERHSCPQPDRCEAEWRPEYGTPQRTAPWSAAFVSAVMRQAGFSPREFRFAAAHAQYIVAARDGQATAFELWSTPAPVLPGDLVCLPRTAEAVLRPMPLADIRDGQDGRGLTPMHCDVVVSVDAAGRRVQVVGGNVQQSVSRRELPLAEDGRLHWQPRPDAAWALVMKPRRAPTALPAPPAAPPCRGDDC